VNLSAKSECLNYGDNTVISRMYWYSSDRYRLLITVSGVGGVGGDFSQTGVTDGQTNGGNYHTIRSVVAGPFVS